MEANFWHERWQSNRIGFHEAEVNPLLLAHFDSLQLDTGQRIFLPLCGKTLDIGWLLTRGVQLTGIELSEIAVRSLFDELSLEPTVTQHADLKLFSADNLQIWVGDFFALQPGQLGTVHAVYDRAALVALPGDMRSRYTRHLTALTGHASQLLITFSYDQSAMQGPPFSLSVDEVQQHYATTYRLSELLRQPMPGGLKGKLDADESVWLLQPMTQ